MGIKHKALPIWGVNFHPESLATEKGIMILKNFINLLEHSCVCGNRNLKNYGNVLRTT